MTSFFFFFFFLRVWGAALKSNQDVQNPIFVSIGHRISLENCVKLVTEVNVFFFFFSLGVQV